MADAGRTQLRLASNRETLIPVDVAPDKWTSVLVDAPGSSFRLEAYDKSETGWVAFAQPREMAAFSYSAMRLTDQGPWLTQVCLGLLAVFTVLGAMFPHPPLPRDRAQKEDALSQP